MIVELLQFFDFIKTGTIRLLFILFFFHVAFLLLVRVYSQRYKPFYHNPSFPHKVSIIIPTWKEKVEWLVKSVKSALDSGAEVIIAYSKCDESALKVVKEFGEKIKEVVFDKRVPKKRAVYEAVKVASGDIVCVLDSDTFISKDAITEICKAFDYDSKIGGVVGYNIIFNKEHFAGRLSVIVESARNFLNKAFSVLGNVHVLDSRFCAYRKEAILPIMDEYLNNKFLGRDVVIGEDKMMTYLLQRNGWKCIMQSSAVDYTAAPETFIGFLKQQLRWARSGYMYFFRHYLCYKLHWLLTFHILLYFLTPILFPIAVFYDICLTPPILNVTLVETMLLIILGVSLITLFRSKILDLEIKWKDIPIIGILGLCVMLPLFLYALITVWNQGSWISR